MDHTIGKPVVLFVDGTQNIQGWEHGASTRLFRSMRRRKVQLIGTKPTRPTSPEGLAGELASRSNFNCMLLAGHGRAPEVPANAQLKSYWDVLGQQEGLALIVLAMWTCGRPDPGLKDEALQAKDLAPIALASEAGLDAKEALFFFSRFFEELTLHSPESITVAMARFSYIKARHFAKGKVEVRY